MNSLIDEILDIETSSETPHKAYCNCNQCQCAKKRRHPALCKCPECRASRQEIFSNKNTLLDEILAEVKLNKNQISSAIRYNNKYARRIGWEAYEEKIRNLLGLTWVHNDWAFVQAVAEWQAKNGYSGKNVDGKLGRGTWKKMKTILKLFAPKVKPAPSNKRLDQLLNKAILLFGGRVIDPKKYSHTLEGFQEYLTASNVQSFTAKEMLIPHRLKTAKALGYKILLPKHEWWARGVALAKIADRLRVEVDSPMRMRNWWRPANYNAKVGGARSSDHILALGVDLDYKSGNKRRIAERYLKNVKKKNPWLKMSLGLGGRTTHVGILTSKGERTWHYSSYRR